MLASAKWFASIDFNLMILLNFSCHWLSIEFPDIRELWNIKGQHKRAVEFVKRLARTDLTWMRIKVGEKSENVSMLDHDKENAEKGITPDQKRISDLTEPFIFSLQDVEEIQRITTQNSTSLISEAPLISAARNGIIEIVEVILQL